MMDFLTLDFVIKAIFFSILFFSMNLIFKAWVRYRFKKINGYIDGDDGLFLYKSVNQMKKGPKFKAYLFIDKKSL